MTTSNIAVGRLGEIVGVAALAACSVLQSQAQQQQSQPKQWTVTTLLAGVEFASPDGKHLVVSPGFGEGMPTLPLSVEVFPSNNVEGICKIDTGSSKAVLSTKTGGMHRGEIVIGDTEDRNLGTVSKPEIKALGDAVTAYKAAPGPKTVAAVAAAEARVEAVTDNCGAGHPADVAKGAMEMPTQPSGASPGTATDPHTGQAPRQHAENAPAIQQAQDGIVADLPDAKVSFSPKGLLFIDMHSGPKHFASNGQTVVELTPDPATGKLGKPVPHAELLSLVKPIYQGMAQSQPGMPTPPEVVEFTARFAEVVSGGHQQASPAPAANQQAQPQGQVNASAMKDGFFYANSPEEQLTIKQQPTQDGRLTVVLDLNGNACTYVDGRAFISLNGKQTPIDPVGMKTLYNAVETYVKNAHELGGADGSGTDYGQLAPAKEEADFTSVIRAGLAESAATRACTAAPAR